MTTTGTSLGGQVAIITGAGQGLGAAYAAELALRGAAVVVNDLPGTSAATRVVADIESTGGQAVVSYNDVATRDGGRALVEAAIDHFGRIDVVINNAGIIRPALFEDLTDDDIDTTVAVHLKAAFYVTQPAYVDMCTRSYGRIVNISSNNSFGVEGLINYCTVKAGVLGFSAGLALEASRHGVLVNSVMPNAMTAMAEEATQAAPIPRLEENTRFLSAYGAVGHALQPARAAALVAYLASPACTVSGEVFSQVGPRYSRVFFGVAQGWMSSSDQLPVGGRRRREYRSDSRHPVVLRTAVNDGRLRGGRWSPLTHIEVLHSSVPVGTTASRHGRSTLPATT